MLGRVPPYFCWQKHTHGTVSPGDCLCVYVTKKGGLGGVVAHGTVASIEWHILPHDLLLLEALRETGTLSTQMMPLAELVDEVKNYPHIRKYFRVFLLDELKPYYGAPVVIDDFLLHLLDIYTSGTVENVGMLVRLTRSLTEHDFRLLTRSDV